MEVPRKTASHSVKQIPTRTTTRVSVVVLLTIHVVLLAWLGAKQSPNVDEPAHLAAGMAMWQYGSFELYCVNPPLMRAVAALPILFMPHEEVWGDFEGAPRPRPEFLLGAQFVESHPDRWQGLLVAARWAIIPFSILGGLFCYFWATEMFGRKAGLLALCLWCFSPNILTWSSLICTDGVAAVMGTAAGYSFWRWLKHPLGDRTAIAGSFLGLALLSKMTWLFLFALWPILWLTWRILSAHRESARAPSAVKMTAVLLIGLCVVNLGYGFQGSGTRLGDYQFHSQILGGKSAIDGISANNRFRGTVLAWVPVPLPSYYVLGLDLQKVDFERGKPSYLFRQWADHGWWYYYLVGFVLKVPLGTWGLGILAVVMCCWRRRWFGNGDGSSPHHTNNTTTSADRVVLLAPALFLLLLVSSQDGMSCHFRYIVPFLPFAFVWISQVASESASRRVLQPGLVLVLLGWSVFSSMTVYPHTMSYFNEVAGGPENGHRYMLSSSFSWSQDHFYLKKWIQDHPEVDSPYMRLVRSVSLEALGLRNRGASPKSKLEQQEQHDIDPTMLGPIPGWHVISVQHIHDRDGGYSYFWNFRPRATIGHSIHVYHIDEDGANRVRRSLGLPVLSNQHTSPEILLDEMLTARDASRHLSVAVLASGVPGVASDTNVRNVLEGESGFALTSLSEQEIREGRLDRIDVLVVPGGKASVQGATLGSDGRNAIRDFVDGGGGYVGICAGAFLATANHQWGLKLINARSESGVRYVPRRGNVSASFRGWGDVSVELTNEGRQLFGRTEPRFQLGYTGGPVFSRANEPNMRDYQPLAYFRSEVWMHPFQKGAMVNTPAILASQFGRGKVILFSPHPEGTRKLVRCYVGRVWCESASFAISCRVAVRPDES
jgi:glutamine amidotransferase-like uncharacterized protein